MARLILSAPAGQILAAQLLNLMRFESVWAVLVADVIAEHLHRIVPPVLLNSECVAPLAATANVNRAVRHPPALRSLPLYSFRSTHNIC